MKYFNSQFKSLSKQEVLSRMPELQSIILKMNSTRKLLMLKVQDLLDCWATKVDNFIHKNDEIDIESCIMTINQLLLSKDLQLSKQVYIKKIKIQIKKACIDVQRMMQVSINLLQGFAAICKKKIFVNIQVETASNQLVFKYEDPECILDQD